MHMDSPIEVNDSTHLDKVYYIVKCWENWDPKH